MNATGHGLFVDDQIMRNYVTFICDQLKVHTGAAVNAKNGFPMKGCYVDVRLDTLERFSRSAELKIKALGFEKRFIFYMSRHKSPVKLLSELQNKIDELVLEIINENGLDQDKIYHEHHPLINFKRS